MAFREIDPKQTKTRDLHQYLIGCVAPRPIAFVSTLDKEGVPNLAPYSFFNAFSSNPPIVVFSSNRRATDNTLKDTLINIMETKEAVINMVNHSIIRQMAVASVEFAPKINEFSKTGLTPIPSERVKPFRVMESPASLECKVREIIALGDKGGAGHLIICDVLLIHILEDVIDEKNRINPQKMDLMGRLGRAYYVRASGVNIMPVVQAVTEICVGYDQLPLSIKESNILTGNDIGLMAGVKQLPAVHEILSLMENDKIKSLCAQKNFRESLQQYSHEILSYQPENGELALKISMLADHLTKH